MSEPCEVCNSLNTTFEAYGFPRIDVCCERCDRLRQRSGDDALDDPKTDIIEKYDYIALGK